MTATSSGVEKSEAVRGAVSSAASSAATGTEWFCTGWADSSWDLRQGLEVVENLPPDAWPAELPMLEN